LWTALFTVIASSFEIHVVAPFLYGQAMGLPSAIILVALVVGARLQGVVGILFAVPVAVILAAILEEAERNLEAETETVERAENGQEPIHAPPRHS
jgi:predicted PurR-regulated permease PerM